MKRIPNWLEEKPSLIFSLWMIPLCVLLYIFYALFASLCLEMLCPNLYAHASSNTAPPTEMIHIGVTGIIGFAFLEELFFRLLPLVFIQFILLSCFYDGKWRIWIIAMTVIISSAIFGYVHGNIINAFVQGAAGIILSVVYLKNGGYLNKSPVKAILNSGITHATINILFLFVVWPLLEIVNSPY